MKKPRNMRIGIPLIQPLLDELDAACPAGSSMIREPQPEQRVKQLDGNPWNFNKGYKGNPGIDCLPSLPEPDTGVSGFFCFGTIPISPGVSKPVPLC
jgi:hypothetical protein